MARLNTPIHSDDEFELLYDAESVSDISDGRDLSSAAPEVSSRRGSTARSQRLTGPHEVPVVPYPDAHDDVLGMTERFQSHSIRTEASSTSAGIHRGSGSTRGMMSDGLQYTKSMYNKLWNKDALIAVMG